jgi:hydrogenase small subunit
MKAEKSTLVWIQGITCNGNSHSFLNYPFLEHFFEKFDFLYHPLLPSKIEFKDVVNKDFLFDILVIEGSLTHKKELLSRHGLGLDEILNKLLPRAKYIVCVGSCAAYGGIFKARDPKSISGAIFDTDVKGGFWKYGTKSKDGFEIINIPGCPAHPVWIAQTLLQLNLGAFPKLDNLHRPKDHFAYLAHHGCIRNEYFEWKVDCEHFGRKEGCLFYEQGCQGPMSHADCNKILWNEISTKTRIGSPCIGCTEPSFPKQNLFFTHKYMSLPAVPVGISKRAYYTLAGVAKSFKIKRLEERLIDED